MSAIRSDGAGQAQLLTQSKESQNPWSFSPDGKRLGFDEQASKTLTDLWTVPIESDGTGLRAGKPEILLQTPVNEVNPAFSTDGKWLAYASVASGSYQVFVRAVPDRGGKWQISTGGGRYPVWSRAGHELFFQALDGRVMTAAYSVMGDSFLADKPRTWSDQRVNLFYPAPDGKRILALIEENKARGSHETQNQVVFLEYFLDELRRKVPVGK
jgi:serine/threonine-protein kinase